MKTGRTVGTQRGNTGAHVGEHRVNTTGTQEDHQRIAGEDEVQGAHGENEGTREKTEKRSETHRTTGEHRETRCAQQKHRRHAKNSSETPRSPRGAHKEQKKQTKTHREQKARGDTTAQDHEASYRKVHKRDSARITPV